MRKHVHVFSTHIVLASVLWLVGTIGVAQAQTTKPEPLGWGLSLGMGLLSNPNYLGDDDRQVMLVPLIKATHGAHWTLGLPEGIQYTINPESSWSWGIGVGPAMGRDVSSSNPFRIYGDGSDDLLGLDETDTAVAVKLFSEFKVASWAIKAAVEQRLGNDPEGTLSLNVSRSAVIKRKGSPLIVFGGFRALMGDSQNVNSLVGVTQEQSMSSGLAAYSANGGLISYGVNATVVLSLSSKLSLVGNLSVDQLATELADSSLIQDRGNDIQFSTGMFLSYRVK